MKTYKDIELTNTMRLVLIENIEKEGDTIYEVLRRDYLERQMTMNEMANKYGIGIKTVQKWLKKYDIPRRKMTFI